MSKSETSNAHSVATRLAHMGRPWSPDMPFVNPPVVRASTVLFEDVHAMHDPASKYVYGRRGTPTSNALADALTELEGPACAGTVLTPSGLAAISVALLSFLGAGDHVLIPDCAYRPVRELCDSLIPRLGVEVSYYDPTIGAGIAALTRANTKVIYLESPGSLTFEIQDTPAIVAHARAIGAVTIIDNTWATPLMFRALDFGVDVTLMAATKYIVGHSDAMLGTVSANEATWKRLKHTHGAMGMFTGPDDMWLALRGLRTLSVRMRHQEQSALEIARWLQTRPEVAQVLHPGLPQDPGHAIWKRDFNGSAGLFGIILKPSSDEAVAAMLDGLQLFGLGYSWGGYESLAIPCELTGIRTATTWAAEGPLVRLQIGLEDPADLIADLDKGLARLNAAG
ncbi:MAG: cystathionine beta-lyase [Hyphomicrobiaceae bacterium]|nr:cystathionine beta-lyase [Hyphomicrobiaceae bacterium]